MFEEPEIGLFARLKGFRTYLENLTQDEEKLDLMINSDDGLSDHIRRRYGEITGDLESSYNSFDDMIHLGHDLNAGNLKHLCYEVAYACDVLEQILNLQANKKDAKSSLNDASENREFSPEEIRRIDEELNRLQIKLLESVQVSVESEQEASRLRQIVISEIEGLKSDSKRIGRKDWKNLLINTAVNLIFMFSFSAEARNTVIATAQVLSMVYYETTVQPSELAPPSDFLLTSD